MNSSLEDIVVESGKTFHPFLDEDSRDLGIRIHQKRHGQLEVTISSLSKRRYSSLSVRVTNEAYFLLYRLLFVVRDERNVEVVLKLAIEALGVTVTTIRIRSIEWA